MPRFAYAATLIAIRFVRIRLRVPSGNRYVGDFVNVAGPGNHPDIATLGNHQRDWIRALSQYRHAHEPAPQQSSDAIQGTPRTPFSSMPSPGHHPVFATLDNPQRSDIRTPPGTRHARYTLPWRIMDIIPNQPRPATASMSGIGCCPTLATSNAARKQKRTSVSQYATWFYAAPETAPPKAGSPRKSPRTRTRTAR